MAHQCRGQQGVDVVAGVKTGGGSDSSNEYARRRARKRRAKLGARWGTERQCLGADFYWIGGGAVAGEAVADINGIKDH